MTQLIALATWSSPSQSVIFIHGLGGHAYDTWRLTQEHEHLWPVWLAEDIGGTNVYTLSYAAPPSNWLGTAMPLEDRAANVLDLLLAEQHTLPGPISFVCHSLGGLVFKQMCREASDREDAGRAAVAEFLARIENAIFIATPHTGSDKASLVARLAVLTWPSEVTLGLLGNHPGLRSLNRWYRGWSARRVHNFSYAETYPTFFGRIVRANEGDPGVIDNDPTPIDGDHFTVAKPLDRNRDLYVGVRQRLAGGAAPQATPNTLQVTQPLPDIEHQRTSIGPRLLRVALLASALVGLVVLAGGLQWRPKIEVLRLAGLVLMPQMEPPAPNLTFDRGAPTLWLNSPATIAAKPLVHISRARTANSVRLLSEQLTVNLGRDAFALRPLHIADFHRDCRPWLCRTGPVEALGLEYGRPESRQVVFVSDPPNLTWRRLATYIMDPANADLSVRIVATFQYETVLGARTTERVISCRVPTLFYRDALRDNRFSLQSGFFPPFLQPDCAQE